MLEYFTSEDIEEEGKMDSCTQDIDRIQGGMVLAGMWLCEAALWTLWENVGRLEAITNCGMLILETDKFAHAMGEFVSARKLVVSYARRFVAELNTKDSTSDIMEAMNLCSQSQ